VPVFINGQGPFDFVIDTGATLSCVDTRIAGRLALREQRGRTGAAATASGMGQVRLVRLDSLRVGEARAADLSACVIDLGHARGVGVEAEGLLGLNFLRAFRVTFDFQRNVLTLAPEP
jgi:clan AA aspartic protease (TIGR02281 family)